MNDIFQSIYAILDNIRDIIYTLFGKPTLLSTSIILILSGILLAFWGYKLKKLALIIIGLVFGISLALIISDILKIQDNNITFILMIVFGIVFGILNLFFYFIAIIIFGIITGFLFGLFLSTLFDFSSTITIITSLSLAILGGLLSINVNKIMFIFITSFFGYILFRTGIYSINTFNISRIIEEILAIIVFLIGLIFQFIDNFNVESSYETKKESVK